jgi:hypothetical protein
LQQCPERVVRRQLAGNHQQPEPANRVRKCRDAQRIPESSTRLTGMLSRGEQSRVWANKEIVLHHNGG